MCLLAVHGPQLVGFVDQEPHILVVVLSQHDAELGGQPAKEEVGEEEASLLSVGAELQHGGQGRLAPRSPILSSWSTFW